MSQVHERFSKAFAQVGAIRKAQRNDFHNYSYRGIDDVMNALHDVLADAELFYVPRLVDKHYDEWPTNKGGRQQVATLDYEFVFYAPDGSELIVGPVTGQAADTDDKAPMKALSQSAKYALLQAFCIPTEDDPDARSPVSESGGRGAGQDWHASLRELLSKVPWPDDFDQDTADLYQAAGIDRMTKGDKNTVSDLTVEQAQFIASKLKTSKQRQRFVEYATEAVEGSEGDGEGKSSSPSDTPPEPSDADRLWADVQALWRNLGIQGPRVLTHARMIVSQDELDDSEGRVAWDDPRDLGPDAHPDVLRGLLSWLEDQQAKAGAA